MLRVILLAVLLHASFCMLSYTDCYTCANNTAASVCYTTVNMYPVAQTCCTTPPCSGTCIAYNTNLTSLATCPSGVTGSTTVQTLGERVSSNWKASNMDQNSVAVFQVTPYNTESGKGTKVTNGEQVTFSAG